MSTDRLAQALRLVRDALDISAPDRDAWVARQCGDDAALRAQVDILLAADSASDGPLDRPLSDQLPAADTGIDPRIGRHVGPYVLRALLGRGGMGAVYRAERSDGGFDQTVALKLLRVADNDDASALRRFAQERQILVRLQHPNIARFLDGGVTDDGQPWYAMELVDGETITHYAQRLALPLPQRLALLMQVCDAVQYAHQNLVLHRDLKPANILVDASGQVKLLDFGIAKLLQADTEPAATHTEHRAYTPDYAAPEQRAGHAVSTATDLYALGVILYELLTDHRPFRRGGLLGIVSAEPDTVDAPSRLRAREGGDRRDIARLRGDLDTIALTCLQADPQRRYASAATLKRDLERHLAGLPIEARPDAFGYRAGKFLRRHRVGFAAGVTLIAALLAATAVSITQAQRATREAERANTLVASVQRERDSALEEVRRQETLREHFVVVLNRATAPGTPIDPDELLALASNPRLLGDFGDVRMQSALQVTLADLFLQRGDFPRVLELLDELEPILPQLPSRVQAQIASTHGEASMRVGRLDDADASIARAQALILPEERGHSIVEGSVELQRGMVLRARGDAAGAVAAARNGTMIASGATDGSPLQRGAMVGSGATAMLVAGELEDAIAFAELAEGIWKKANVSNNVFTRTVAGTRANALYVRGDLLASLAAIDAVNSDQTTESPPPRAARDLTEAKVLALLARPDGGLRVLDGAIRGMCGAVGVDSHDCLRVRLSGVDTRIVAGKTQDARRELDILFPKIAEQPLLLTTAKGFDRVLKLLEMRDEAALATLLDAAPVSAATGPLPRRSAVRSLLLLAETFQREGNPAFATRLAQAAIDVAGDAIDSAGMDRSLLALWDARLQGQPVPAEALAALAKAVGPTHPYVLAHTPAASAAR